MRTCRHHCCSLLSTRSCWLHSCILSTTFLTASSFAFLASLSGLVLDVQILGALRALSSISLFLCASLGPRYSLLLSCNVTSFTVSCVRILLRCHGLYIPAKGTTPEIVRSGSVRPTSRRPCSCLMLSLHHSQCNLTSALICAVLRTSLEPPPAGRARECASCAHRENDFVRFS